MPPRNRENIHQGPPRPLRDNFNASKPIHRNFHPSEPTHRNFHNESRHLQERRNFQRHAPNMAPKPFPTRKNANQNRAPNRNNPPSGEYRTYHVNHDKLGKYDEQARHRQRRLNPRTIAANIGASAWSPVVEERRFADSDTSSDHDGRESSASSEVTQLKPEEKVEPETKFLERAGLNFNDAWAVEENQV